jgi:hypothetical protein
MTQHLVVIRPFPNLVGGGIIANSPTIRGIPNADYAKFVTRAAPPSASKG